MAALERKGYVERSFFRTPTDGVVLVTRLERINDDGTSPGELQRWPTTNTANSPSSSTDVLSFLHGLFYTERGHYRIIAFVLQSAPFSQSAQQVKENEARDWLRAGFNALPAESAARPFDGASCTALIYEFTSDGSSVKLV